MANYVRPYLQKRGRRYYAILEIPKALRPRFGKKVRFVQSLKTDSLAQAERRVLQVVAGWKRQLEEAKGDGGDMWSDLVSAKDLWRALRNAKNEEERQSVMYTIDMAAWDIGWVDDPEARRFAAIAYGSIVNFTEHLDEWLATSRVTTKTQDRQRSDVRRFTEQFPTVQDVSRPEVKRWVSGLMNQDGLTPKTVHRILSALRGYWRHLQSINVADEELEPFSKLDVARQNKRTGRKSKRREFEPADVLKLLDAATEREDQQLADLIRLGMWTGCRIEELCALTVDQVQDDHFVVVEAKTEAGEDRGVPIHRELAQTMARLIQESTDDYVMSGLVFDKYEKRSGAIGKRFSKLKTDLGFGREYVFHSLRKTVATILENALVPENVSADILGHEKTTMTYGVYSGGASLEVKRKELAKLEY